MPSAFLAWRLSDPRDRGSNRRESVVDAGRMFGMSRKTTRVEPRASYSELTA